MFSASWSLPHSSITNGSLTEMQTIESIPWSAKTGASSLKRGRCVDEQVGVNAPGSENTTTFLPAKMSALVTVVHSPLRRRRNVTSGTRWPSRLGSLAWDMADFPCLGMMEIIIGDASP